jgi:FAD-dependent sensor of blue light
MFVQTIYDSRAHVRITDHDIARITAQSLPYNLANGLTSYLYYDDWRFLQVLEGRPAQVADAMARIDANPMHHCVKVRLMTRSTTRDFEGWPIGTLSADDTELRRVLKSFGFKDVFQCNVLEAIKILRRVAGRKLRTMTIVDKQALSDPGSVKMPEKKVNLTEDMLGLRS